MQKLPVAIVLASLVTVVAVAKTQQNEKQQSNARPARTTDSHQPIVYTSARNPLPKDVQERLDAATARAHEAEIGARELLDKGQLVAAEAECRRALGLDIVILNNGVRVPPQGPGIRLLGDIQLARRHYQEALESYGVNNPHRMRHLSGDPEMCLRIAQCYVGLNDFERALKFFNYLIRRHPAWHKDLPGAGNLRSLEATLLMLRAGDGRSSEQAMLRFRAAENLAPTNWLIADRIGELLHDTNRYDEAIPSYRRAMQLGDDKVSYGHRMRVEMYDRWQKQNKQEAEKFLLGQYELDSRWENANGTKTFIIIEIQPGGRYTEQTYWGIKWQNEKPNPKLLPRNLTYIIHADGTYTEQRTGTYVVTGDEIDLTDDSGPNAFPRFNVKSCRLTRNGLVLLRQFSLPRLEDMDGTKISIPITEQLFMKIR